MGFLSNELLIRKFFFETMKSPWANNKIYFRLFNIFSITFVFTKNAIVTEIVLFFNQIWRYEKIASYTNESRDGSNCVQPIFIYRQNRGGWKGGHFRFLGQSPMTSGRMEFRFSELRRSYVHRFACHRRFYHWQELERSPLKIVLHCMRMRGAPHRDNILAASNELRHRGWVLWVSIDWRTWLWNSIMKHAENSEGDVLRFTCNFYYFYSSYNVWFHNDGSYKPKQREIIFNIAIKK